MVVYVGMNDSQGRYLRPMDQLEHLVFKDEHITIMAYVDGWNQAAFAVDVSKSYRGSAE